MGLYGDNGTENGNYYVGFRVEGLGFDRMPNIQRRIWPVPEITGRSVGGGGGAGGTHNEDDLNVGVPLNHKP